MMKLTLYQHRIIERKKRREEEYLKDLEINWDAKTREWIRGLSLIHLGSLGGMRAELLPKDDVAFPDGIDDLLNDSLAQETLRARHCGDLEGIETLEVMRMVGA